jgi:hypothetical protein
MRPLSWIVFAGLSFSNAFATTEVDLYAPYVQEFSQNAKTLAEEVENPYLAIKSEEIKYFPTGLQYDRLQASFTILEKVVNSQAFKEKVIGYINGRGKREFQSNKKLTNEQIYLKLMEGRELLGPETPGVANLYIWKYYKRGRVIGYTSPGASKWINVNWNYYAGFKEPSMAGNIFHEWIHLMGFYHSSASDYDSVPYAIGRIVVNLAALYQKQGYLD